MDRMIKVALALVFSAIVLLVAINMTGTLLGSRLPSRTSNSNNGGNPTVDTASGEGESYVDEDGMSINSYERKTEEDYLELESKYDFDSDLYPYFGLLNEEQKKAYYFIYEAATKLEDGVYIGSCVKVESDEVSDVVNAVYYDHPELFWMEPRFRYTYGRHYMVVTVKLTYNGLADDLPMAKREFEAKANEILSEVQKDYSKGLLYQEAKLHDILCAVSTYDSNAEYDQSAYSCIVNGKTVCSGYARAFQYLMHQMGTPVYYVVGKTYDGGEHAWNLIRINGKFYNVDVTWDDSIGEKRSDDVHAYFNITDEAISKTHSRTDMSEKLPECTDDGMTYDKNIGVTVTIDELNFE